MQRKIRIVIAASLLLIAMPFALIASGSGEVPLKGSGEIVVLHTNDFHGHPLKFYHYPMPDVGGLPAIATLVEDVRAKHPNVLVLDAGDMNIGRPESSFFNAAPDIIGYNYIGYDAMTLGNHEFDKPLTNLENQRKMARFPFLSANVHYADGTPIAEPYIIKTLGNIRVGIFGLTTNETPTITSPSITGDLIFEDEVEAAKRIVAELKPKVDIIIAVGHLGLYDDATIGSRRVASMVDGIDLFIDGHSHTQLEEASWENETPIVQAWQWGLYVGKATLTVDKGELSAFDWEPIPVNLKEVSKDADGNNVYTYLGAEYPEDPYLLAALTPYETQVEIELQELVGMSTAFFGNSEIRKTEAALGNLVSDSMLWATEGLEVDFAIQNGGGIRSDLTEGPINKKLIYEILPFDNSVMVVDMTGAEVQEMFDFIPTIPRGKGGFPQVSRGVKFTVDFTSGETRDISINNEPIDPGKTYKVATNSFMAAGGDSYDMMTNGYQYDTSKFQRDALIDYIEYLDGIVSPEIEGRITVIE